MSSVQVRCLKWFSCLPLAVATLFFAAAPGVLSEPHPQADKQFEETSSKQQLTGEEIKRAFSNVRDDAQVQDAAGTSAVNYWHADGRFINRWSNAAARGEVIGRWRVVGDKRCINIQSGLPEREGKEFCSPIYRAGTDYVTINADGSIHGVHTLSPMTEQEKTRR